MYISQKGKKIPTNVKNGKKQPKIANNCKISEITKYGDKIAKLTTIYKNVQKCQKRAKNWPN